MDGQRWITGQQQQSGGAQAAYPYISNDEIRTLWIGDLQPWADESYLHTCFSHAAEVLSTKVIRNHLTGQPEGYGFVEFSSHEAALNILQTYNGTLHMPGTQQFFKLNWASSSKGEKRAEYSVFVGDLAPHVTDDVLQETFASRYISVRGAKVVKDVLTGRSKGYGFVKFCDENERNRALTEMNGEYCSHRPMRVSVATSKVKTPGFHHQNNMPAQPIFQAGNAESNQWGWSTQTDSNQCNMDYSSYGYGDGYNAQQQQSDHAYGAYSQDPSCSYYPVYDYGYHNYYQQPTAEVQEIAMANTHVQAEEADDSLLAPPDVEKLNAEYIAVHQSALLGRHLWLTTSDMPKSKK
eukprot:Gb_00656 [translate_table: standard]